MPTDLREHDSVLKTPEPRLTRRSLGHLAWAVPAVTIATSAPAFAASQTPTCGSLAAPWSFVEYGQTYTYDGRTFRTPDSTKGTPSSLTAGTTFSSTFAAIKTSTGELRYRTNGVFNDGSYGFGREDVPVGAYNGKPDGTGKKWLTYGQNATKKNGSWFTSYYTFIASETMYNVTLWIADVDSMPDLYYQDKLWVDGGVTPTATLYADRTISGTGTSTDPWLAELGTPWGNGPRGDNGLLRLDWAELKAGQMISLRYSSQINSGRLLGNYQFVYFSPIRYSTVQCV